VDAATTVVVQQWRNINLNPNRHPSCPPFAHQPPLSSSFVYFATSGTGDGASLSWWPALFTREFLLQHSVPGLLRASYLFMPLSSLGPLSSALIRLTLLYSQTTLDSIRARVVPTR